VRPRDELAKDPELAPKKWMINILFSNLSTLSPRSIFVVDIMPKSNEAVKEAVPKKNTLTKQEFAINYG
jgi:hypothetical protein